MGHGMSWKGQGSPQERQMGELLVLPSRKAGCCSRLLQMSSWIGRLFPWALLLCRLLADAVVSVTVV